MGRFMQADRWGGSAWSPYASHPFTYAANNPLFFIDPYGLFEFHWAAAKQGFVTGFTGGIYFSLKGSAFNAVVKFAAGKIPGIGQAMFVLNLIRTTQSVIESSKLVLDLVKGSISDKEVSNMVGEAVGEEVAGAVMNVATKGVAALVNKVKEAVKKRANRGGNTNSSLIGGVSTPSQTISITQANSTRGWKLGDPINNLTSNGQVPSWSTVRKRYWKNRANNATTDDFSLANLARMRRGLAPQTRDPITGKIVSMELHHDPPQRDGALFDFKELWPWQHAIEDPHRFY